MYYIYMAMLYLKMVISLWKEVLRTREVGLGLGSLGVASGEGTLGLSLGLPKMDDLYIGKSHSNGWQVGGLVAIFYFSIYWE